MYPMVICCFWAFGRFIFHPGVLSWGGILRIWVMEYLLLAMQRRFLSLSGGVTTDG